MNQLENIAVRVRTKEDFLVSVDALIYDLKNNPDTWENSTLETYLEAIQSWTEDMEGYYENNHLPVPTNIPWNVFTDILVAAKMYE